MNWDAIILSLIGSLPPTIVAAAAFVQARKTHKSVNGMKHELIDSVRKEATAQATLDEKGAQKTREGEAAVTEQQRQHDASTIIRDRD